MNDKFYDLKQDKQDRIINAALQVFGMQGFRRASTDDIVRVAHISKGLVFHYFSSKVGMYSFVYEYAARYLSLGLRSGVPEDETDPFVLLRALEATKLSASRSYPYIMEFMHRASIETDEEVADTKNLGQPLKDFYAEFYKQMDWSILPAGIDPRKLCTMMDCAIKGVTDQYTAIEPYDVDALYGEIECYIAMVERLCKNK